jgi:hypothetical protein
MHQRYQCNNVRHGAAQLFSAAVFSCTSVSWLHCCTRSMILLALAGICGCVGVGAVCTASQVATYQTCPTALQAVQILTNSSPYLPISNAAWSGPLAACNKASTYPVIIVSSFPTCNHLASWMPQGALVRLSGRWLGSHVLKAPQGLLQDNAHG